MDIMRDEILDCIYNNILGGKYEESERLLEISAVNPNDLVKDTGISLLHLAAGVEPEKFAESMVELLLKYGGDPNTKSEEGMTALHVGAAWGRSNIIKILLAAGGDPNLPDFDGKTPLDYAAEQEDQDILECFYMENNETEFNDSPKKFSLKLEKVLINNGIVEGEYYPEDIATVEAFKKSDYINEWFAKSPILEKSNNSKQSNSKDSDKTPTNSVNSINSHKNNKTLFHSNIDSPINNTFYESCLSGKICKNSKSWNSLFTSDTSCENVMKIQSGKINSLSLMSGIEPIETTGHTSNNVDEYNQFTITDPTILKPHENYKTRTNLKTKTCEILDFYNNEEQFNEFNQSVLSIMSNRTDKTQDVDADCSSSECTTQTTDCFNKAVVTSNLSVGTNISLRTNGSQKSHSSRLNSEFVTIERGKYKMNSFSSRNGSFLNDTIPSVAEEYKYHDEEANIAFIEKRMLVNAPLSINASANQSAILSTVSSAASSLPMSLNYDTDTLRKELLSFGCAPGPITKTTKKVYLRRLKNIKKNPIISKFDKTTGKTYSIELEKTFRDANWCTNLSNYISLERKLVEQFDTPNPNKKWREGTIKSSFTYLLLDPRITDNLPCKADTMQPADVWKNFINSIFYIGKGKRSRPYAHLYDAATLHKSGKTSKTDNEKVETILNIWKEKCGVVCLHIFQNVIPVEAYTREAAMIEVIGLKNLKNIKPGNYYGSVVSWSLKEKKLLGVYLLYRAMLIFLNEGERQLRPEDIK